MIRRKSDDRKKMSKNLQFPSATINNGNKLS